MSRVEPNRNVYVGHRYVPKIFGEWDKQNQYEGLSIVTHQGNSYTSKKRVPVGIDILNEEFWVVTGNYNAQVENYRDDVKKLKNGFDEFKTDTNSTIDDFKNETNSTIDGFKNETNNTIDEFKNATDTQINEFENEFNIELSKKVNGTTHSTDIYVDPNGNDNNDGNSSSNALKTFKKAVSMIPDVIAHDHKVTINVGIGEWNEQINIENKVVHGTLEIIGVTDNRENHKISDLRLNNITGYSIVKNLYATKQSGTSFRFNRCAPHVLVENVEGYGSPETGNTDEGYIGLLADYGSNVMLRYSHFENKRYGYRCNYLSRIFSSNNTGSGNTFGVGARWGGIVHLYGTTPTGSTIHTTSSGGLIVDGRGEYLGLPLSDRYMVNRQRSHHDDWFTKNEYVIDSINRSNRPITDNQQLSMYFNQSQYGVSSFEISYGGQKEDGYPEYIKAIWSGYVGGKFLRSSKVEVVSSNSMTEDNIKVESTSDGMLKISIIPKNAMSSRWRVDISSNIHRNQPAPTLENVVIEDV